jgi:hypothetical protein
MLKFLRRYLRVDIVCPHGEFWPATYRVGKRPATLSCDACEFKVRLTWTREPHGDL